MIIVQSLIKIVKTVNSKQIDQISKKKQEKNTTAEWQEEYICTNVQMYLFITS